MFDSTEHLTLPDSNLVEVLTSDNALTIMKYCRDCPRTEADYTMSISRVYKILRIYFLCVKCCEDACESNQTLT